MKQLIEFSLIGLLITTSAVAQEVDRPTPPEITRYCVTEIGADSELNHPYIVGLDRRGQVLGLDYVDGRAEVFLWDQKHGYKFIDELAHEQTIPALAAAGFNDRGQIVGTQPIEPAGAFLRAVIWQKGKGLQFLEPAPGDDNSVAVDINNRGEVAGITGPYPSESTLGERPVIWDRHGRVTVIPLFPGSTSGRPYAMNDAGQVIGATDSPGAVLGFIWDRTSGLRAIPGLVGGRSAVPSSINDHGDVVGSYDQQAIFWSEKTGTVKLAGLTVGIDHGNAHDINNHRQIVGISTTQRGGEAVIWDSQGQAHNLNELIIRDKPDDQYLYLLYGWRISDAGWITTFGFDARDREYHTYLLTPARLSPTGTYDCSSGK